MMVNRFTDPTTIPTLAGVNIQWDHGDAAPALDSRHGHGEAVDMTIAWSATLSIADPQGGIVQIDSMPRSRMHADLATVGASYGVVLFKPSKPPVSRTLAWPSCARRAPSSGTSRSFPPRRPPSCSAPPGWAPGFGLRGPGARASRASGAASTCWPSESPRIDAVQADGGLRQ